MLSPEKARSLLKRYEKDLNAFQILINNTEQHLLRCDVQILPNVLEALKSIANKSAFDPQVATSGMSSLKVLSTNPIEALKELLVNEYYHEHFKSMCTHYAGNKPKLLTILQNFHATICQDIAPISSKGAGFFVNKSNIQDVSKQEESTLRPQ